MTKLWYERPLFYKNSVNIDGKNGEVDVDRKNMEDNEGENEDSAMNTKSIIDPDVMNFRKADKSIRNIISALFGTVGKRVCNANKGAGATTSNFSEEVGKDINDQSTKNCISIFLKEVRKKVDDDALANILIDIFKNPFSDLNFPLICAAANLVNKFYTQFAISAIVDIFAKLHTNLTICAITDTLTKPFIYLDTIFKE